jgi:hypothetical protein
MTYVECKPDELMVRVLGISRKNLRHENDKPRVCRRLSENRKSTGMVDEDPHTGQDKYIQLLKFSEEQAGVKVLLDNKRDKKSSCYALV